MRAILMALALGISVASVASPALAERGDGNKTDLGTIDRILTQSERDTPQISVGVVAGSDQPHGPALQEQRYENMEGK